MRPQTAALGGVCGNSGWCSPRRRPCVEEGRNVRGDVVLGQRAMSSALLKGSVSKHLSCDLTLNGVSTGNPDEEETRGRLEGQRL